MDVSSCRNRGFSSINLLCSSCDDLDQFNLSSLKDDCQQCCQEDHSTEDSKIVGILKSVLSHSHMFTYVVFMIKPFYL